MWHLERAVQEGYYDSHLTGREPPDREAKVIKWDWEPVISLVLGKTPKEERSSGPWREWQGGEGMEPSRKQPRGGLSPALSTTPCGPRSTSSLAPSFGG